LKSEFVPQKNHHLFQIKGRLFNQMVEQSLEHDWSDTTVRPPLISGALTLPTILILKEIFEMVLLLQSAACAISVLLMGEVNFEPR
jgi:hypothetical protein